MTAVQEAQQQPHDAEHESTPEARLGRELAAGAFAGVTELDLANRGLASLPAALCTGLPGLTKLNMAGNALTTLPPEFERLTSLRTAFFLGNGFTTVPEVLGRLPALFMLSFKSCQLHDVPEASLAPSLGWLILTDNQLTALPASLGRLSHLRKLMLASNQLTTLPDMSGCVALELVRLSDNRLDAVPPGLLALPRLAWVALAGNHLQPRHRDAPLDLPPRLADTAAWPDVTLGRQLGDGASGTVYEAMHGQAQRAVAVKVYKPASSDGRVVDEVAAAIALAHEDTDQHPNLIQTHGFIQRDDAAPALVMELLDPAMELLGRTPSFASVTRDVYPARERAFPLRYVVAVARGVAAAVAHMHARGLIHGDVYAHNILVDAAELPSTTQSTAPPCWRVKLADLGAAFFFHSESNADSPDNAAAHLLKRVESRALGCLLEELIERCAAAEASQEASTLAALCRLRDACLDYNVGQRPEASELVVALDKLIF
ncbi:serine/threonine protein kinase [Acanthamoeba castellanii str. Neff]|uniref:Serine/threonine protein kinase n=1 Tax=Acanthamoeba castellanii (strain ATCC 30010 / Neff) TaxID=1257118 RepID=L8HCN6_ACACF|nr:serine/threonine protein kinase [Acanthamoeba castellanii str. Neff]ELR23309.1 serine/threonine protein kinase [Acanthamoeba castellanii str. Neff]